MGGRLENSQPGPCTAVGRALTQVRQDPPYLPCALCAYVISPLLVARNHYACRGPPPPPPQKKISPFLPTLAALCELKVFISRRIIGTVQLQPPRRRGALDCMRRPFRGRYRAFAATCFASKKKRIPPTRDPRVRARTAIRASV